MTIKGIAMLTIYLISFIGLHALLKIISSQTKEKGPGFSILFVASLLPVLNTFALLLFIEEVDWSRIVNVKKVKKHPDDGYLVYEEGEYIHVTNAEIFEVS